MKPTNTISFLFLKEFNILNLKHFCDNKNNYSFEGLINFFVYAPGIVLGEIAPF